MNDTKIWEARSRPERHILHGNYCRLEPLHAAHSSDLYTASMAEGAEERFRYLATHPQTHEELDRWLALSCQSEDPLFFAVVDQVTNRCLGRQALMRIKPQHGVIEIGHVLWGPGMARTRLATEAFYLHASYVFDTLRYRRFEWKCDAANAPSRRAAERFGFTLEGIFRQHMVIKSKNRDTAWFSMLDSEWPQRKRALQSWLAPENFDQFGNQKKRLIEYRDQCFTHGDQT